MSFAGRLVLGTVLILVLTVGILFALAERSLRRGLEAEIGHTLENEAALVREALPADSMRWPGTLRRLTAQTEHRITLIDRNGRVLADSDFPVGPLPAIENHAARPEVRTAMAGGTGVSRRISETVGRPLLYVAVPSRFGVVRVAAGLDQVDQVVKRAHQAVAGAALVALLVGTLLALAAARSIARPLVEIGSAARAIAGGAAPRFPRSGIPDIDSLVQALRQMHQQLGDRFSQLRREQAESAVLVESMVEGVIASDERGRIVTANPAARRLLGYEASEPLPGLPELFRVKAAREVVDAVLKGESVQDRELEMGQGVYLINARPLPSGGAILVMHDLTDARRLQTMRRDFVANVSHELKTPLTSISGYAETLLGDSPDPVTSQQFLNTILGNARRMQRLVDNLLDLAQIESGHWQPHPEVVELEPVALETWSSIRNQSAAQTLEFRLEVPPDAATVYADADAVEQVLTNLIDNAVRYTPPGGHIVFSSMRDGPGVTISVSDTGSGIAGEHLPRIFERFYRSDASRSRDQGGTGLGLAIVKHLVEAHGGRVSADSGRGLGTTISCWFPEETAERGV